MPREGEMATPTLHRTSHSVKVLTDLYANGDIAIPEIQRDFVWKAPRIKALVDSINHDYPSGAIILWQPGFKGPELEMLIRPERLHLYKERPPKYLLVDGQQRLTALCSVILPLHDVIESLGEEVDLPTLYINVKTLAIEEKSDPSFASNNEVLLNRMLSAEKDDSGLTAVLTELSGRKDITAAHRNNLREFRERILQYSYPVQVLDGHSYKTVAEIFRRVNSQGKVLVTAELELAKIVPHWKGFAAHLRKFIKELRREGFNAGLPFYMRCLAFIATNWPPIKSFSDHVEKGEDRFQPAELEKHWQKTKRAIKKVHASLRRSKIDRTELITSHNAMVPMAYALANDRKNKISDALLAKWLVFSMVGGHYAKAAETALRKDSYLLTGSGDMHNRFEKLYRRMVKSDLISTRFEASDFEGPPARNPAMLCIYQSLCHKGAVDFDVAGRKEAPPIPELANYHLHHIFPVEFMLADDDAETYRKQNRLSRPEFKEQINDVANLSFISLAANQGIKKRPPYDYLAKLTTTKNLEAHCIPKDAELWRPENFDRFCEERRRLLAKAMNSYIRCLKE
jgi:hypothetical protein